jgi:xanthine dehydrogenase accessory factor
MREVITQLAAVLSKGRPAAYCRLVETRGSTPQKAGAAMLVFPDGGQAGTLGGGCVEAEVKRRALAVLQEGTAEIADFQLDHDYGWDDGLICGGRMQVLIEPLRENTDADYFHTLGNMIDTGAGVTEAIVFNATASGLPSPSSVMFDVDGRFVTSHPRLPDMMVEQMRASLRSLATRPRPYASHGIAYLPLPSRCHLVIVGGGHVGQAVAALAAELDFDVCVVDDRADIVSAERFPRAHRRIAGQVDQVLPKLEITPNTYCLIVTRGHNHDEEALYNLVERGARYVGLIGSRRKIRMIFDDLLSQGIAEDSLARVHAPVGIDIGSQTVPEIAVSICAEIVSHRNREGIVPGRPEAIEVS